MSLHFIYLQKKQTNTGSVLKLKKTEEEKKI